MHMSLLCTSDNLSYHGLLVYTDVKLANHGKKKQRLMLSFPNEMMKMTDSFLKTKVYHSNMGMGLFDI